MIAFVVSYNGKKLCTAGIGDDGVLTSSVTWSGHPGSNHLHTHIGGLDSRTDEHKGWASPPLSVGDEFTTRVVEVEEVDEPVESRRHDAKIRPSFNQIAATLILLNPETGQWEAQESREFTSMPRIGEWVELETDGNRTMARIVMVAHGGESDPSPNLYAVIEGSTVDCLRRLSESEGSGRA